MNRTATAARGFVAVLIAALAFFGFVVASGTLGDVAQAAVGLAIAAGVALYLWLRLRPEARARLVSSVRRPRRAALDRH